MKKMLILFLIFAAFSCKTMAEREKSLSLEERQEIFYHLVEYQDKVPWSAANKTEHDEEAYKVIAKRYGITEEKVEEIAIEGAMQNWPMPPPPKE